MAFIRIQAIMCTRLPHVYIIIITISENDIIIWWCDRTSRFRCHVVFSTGGRDYDRSIFFEKESNTITVYEYHLYILYTRSEVPPMRWFSSEWHAVEYDRIKSRNPIETLFMIPYYDSILWLVENININGWVDGAIENHCADRNSWRDDHETSCYGFSDSYWINIMSSRHFCCRSR